MVYGFLGYRALQVRVKGLRFRGLMFGGFGV